MSSAGDVNGDGFDDVLIGAGEADGPVGMPRILAGETYVVFGKADWSASPTLELATLNGTNGFTLFGVRNDRSGSAVSGTGDVNGDGFDDFVIGAFSSDGLGNAEGGAGESYILFGRNVTHSVTLGVEPASLAEAAGTSTVTATLAAVSNVDVTVRLGFSGTAENVSDYTRSATQIVIAAGSTTGTVTLTGVRDALDEAQETIVVDITGVTNGFEFGLQRVTATIADTAILSITAANTTKPEGHNGSTAFTFTVSRTGDLSSSSSVPYAVTGSGSNVADAGDFVGNVLPQGTVTFGVGVTTQTLTISISGDTLVEKNEGFRVTLANPSMGAVLGTLFAAGQIQNDDASVSIAADRATKTEGHSDASAFTFTVTRTGNTSGSANVNYAVTGSGTNPANAADFGGTLPAGIVSFAIGETSKTLTINISGDTLVEKSEGFRVTLSNPPVGTVLATPLAAGLILNDDASVSLVPRAAPKRKVTVARPRSRSP